jgi:hypothetical protein
MFYLPRNNFYLVIKEVNWIEAKYPWIVYFTYRLFNDDVFIGVARISSWDSQKRLLFTYIDAF